ncbi:MAG TPA: hypothetical protein VJ464_09570 [Blastocatellia bacterium]|nr:hypothetical protein [Blastocatellia bacterium]
MAAALHISLPAGAARDAWRIRDIIRQLRNPLAKNWAGVSTR